MLISILSKPFFGRAVENKNTPFPKQKEQPYAKRKIALCKLHSPEPNHKRECLGFEPLFIINL